MAVYERLYGNFGAHMCGRCPAKQVWDKPETYNYP